MDENIEIRNEELTPELVPKISDDRKSIARFSRTLEPFDRKAFLEEKRYLLRAGDFENIDEARKVLYLVFWSLHWAMEGIEEDMELYVQMQKSLEYIRNYAINLESN